MVAVVPVLLTCFEDPIEEVGGPMWMGREGSLLAVSCLEAAPFER